MWYKSNPMGFCEDNTSIIIISSKGSDLYAGVVKYTKEGQPYLDFRGVEWDEKEWEGCFAWAYSPFNNPGYLKENPNYLQESVVNGNNYA